MHKAQENNCTNGRLSCRRKHITMRCQQMTQQVLKGLFLAVLALASCSAPSDDGAGGGCGGSDASITCLNVTSIVPTYLDEDTSNVDALQDVCTRDPKIGRAHV